MSDYVLRTFDLVKRYGNQVVLDRVSMTIEKGQIYGFVGENGSGKTTVIRTICGLIFAEAGSYELFGVPSTDPDIYKVRKKMGAIVESPSIYPNMTAKENLAMLAMILGIKDETRILTALRMVGLEYMYNEKKKVGNFSLGMRQRLGIAMSLLSEAEFMVLDEPLNGLDPEGIVEIRNLILHLNKEYGITFLISSHILTELSLVATKYGVISKGHIIKEITAEELRNQCQKSVVIQTSDKLACYNALTKIVAPEAIKDAPLGYIVYGEIEMSDVITALQGVKIDSINTSSSTIEDYYLSLIRGGRNNG